MIPLWIHVSVVLTLLTSNLLTMVFARRAIRNLKLALVAKRALLGDEPSDWAHIAVVNDGRRTRLLLNGQMVGESPAAGPFTIEMNARPSTTALADMRVTHGVARY